MHIALNGMALGQRNGTGRYTRELIKALIILARSKGVRLSVLYPGRQKIPYGPWDDYIVPFGTAGAVWHYSQLPKYLDRSDIDLYHDLCHFHPQKSSVPAVVTIHDLACLDNATWCSVPTNVRFRLMARKTVKNATVVVPSEFTAGRIKDLLGATSIVIPHGGDHIEFPATMGSYLANVGGTTVRKGKDKLSILKNSPDIPELRLFKGGDDSDLAAFYAGAFALISLSHYEGFGLDVLEAARNGLPVICRPLPPFVEMLGDAYPYIASDDPKEIGRLTEKLMDAKYWKAVSKSGKKKTEKYTWEKTAKLTWSVYEGLMRA